MEKSPRRFRLLLIFEVLVVFLTTYLLIIPALTWEKCLICGLEEHVHTDSCYEGGVLVCRIPEHTHSDSCFDAPPAQFDPYGCGFEEHTHSDSCYDETGALVCSIPEHTHSDRCLKNDAAPRSSPAVFAASLGASPTGTAITSASGLNNLANGGAYYLNADITVTGSVTVGWEKSATLDLNGHNLISRVSGALFKLDNSSLTIVNSKAVTESILTVSDPASMWANAASYSGGTLIYYVTDTEVVDPSVGKTVETLKKITVSKGIIAGNQSGRFAEIGWNGGTLTLSGGYICNFRSDDGGAVNMSSGKLVLNGAVLAANTANNHGGAIFMNGSATAEMSAGVLSGNIAAGEGGGAVFIEIWKDQDIWVNAFTLSGGYVTNNAASSEDYWHGGGGFLLKAKALLTVTGGYITGNRGGGGGAIKTWQDWGGRSGAIEMSGGFVTANNSTSAEGGGVNINAGGYLCLTGGFFTNNIAGKGKKDDSFEDWGGGGLFCSENSATIRIENALVTENHAGGFGGGVAGCSTGRISVSPENGLAVFGNEALGQHTSGTTSAKNEDHFLAKESPVFMANGYQDYFCALGSTITSGMLGGGNSRWTGSSDGRPVRTLAKDEIITGASVTGLTSEASEADRKAAKRAAKVFFNGNESPTHGGGILANGYLVFGTNTDVTNYARISLNGKKVLYGTDGSQKAIAENEFTFILSDDKGNILGSFGSKADGSIPLDRVLTFTAAGSFRYYLREDPSAESTHPGLQMDGKVYRIDATTALADIGTVPWTNFTLKQIQITSLTVTDETAGKTLFSGDPDDDTAKPTEVKEELVFENREVDLPSGATMSVKVEKKWEGNAPGGARVQVMLLCDGEPYGDPVTLQSGRWTHTWTGLDESHTYTVREISCPSGYYPSISYSYSQTYSEKVGPSNEAVLYHLEGDYFVKASSAAVGEIYLIAYPTGGKILRSTSAHADAALDASDAYDLAIQNGRYPASAVPASCRFKVVTTYQYDSGNGEAYTRNVLENQEIGSWLLAQEAGGTFLKGTSGVGWSSAVRLSGGHLQLQETWVSGHEWRYVIWDGSKFNTNTSLGNVILKEVTASTRNAVITNQKTASRSFTIGITKADVNDPSEILPGAVFTLKKDGQELKFVFDAIHECYTLSSSYSAKASMQTSASGGLIISGLSAGNYTLTETTAPPGYTCAEPLTFTLGDDTPEGAVTFVIRDSPVDSRMPETGGTGTVVFRLSGVLLTAIAVMALLLRRRKERRKPF